MVSYYNVSPNVKHSDKDLMIGEQLTFYMTTGDKFFASRESRFAVAGSGLLS